MRISLKNGFIAGASTAFIALFSTSLTVTPASAGPLAVTPKANIALPDMTEAVQYRRNVRHGRYHHAGRYHGGQRYGYHHGGVSPFLPLALFGAVAAGLGGAAYGGSGYCDPAYYTWNYGGRCGHQQVGYSAYGAAHYPAYSHGYYPAYSHSYYPAYRQRPVIYRSSYQRPRTFRYRAIAPQRHFVGQRTHVRAGYGVRRVGR